MSSISVNTITDASGGSTTSINGFTPSVSNMAGRNRIINGDMRIDQRNAGASVTPAASAFTLDRWEVILTQASKLSFQQNAGSVALPSGFTNYLGTTSTSAYSVVAGDFFGIRQKIEGFNVADLGWGAVGAQTVTLSFWVRSSLTGTFGGSLFNADGSRSYPFTFTISAANTWEQKSVTVAGDTTGTWGTGNGPGIQVNFSLGTGSTYSGTAGSWSGNFYLSATGGTSVVGTSGATFYITGVQLEEGSVATPFEHRQYGQELALCQRYFQKQQLQNIPVSYYNARQHFFGQTYIVPMRSTPTITVESSQTNTSGNISGYSSGTEYTVNSINRNEDGINFTQTTVSISNLEPMLGIYSVSAEL